MADAEGHRDDLTGGIAVGYIENREIVYSRDLIARQDDWNVRRACGLWVIAWPTVGLAVVEAPN